MKHIVLLVVAACSGQAALAADLLSVYQDARQSDAKFASARYQLEAGREKLPQARAGVLPTLTLSGNSAYVGVDTTLPVERDFRYNTNGYSLQLTQPLFRWQNWVGLQQGEIQVKIAEAQFATAEADLLLRSTQAYFDLLNAQDVLNAVSQLRKAASEQLQLSKKSFEVGTVTVTDVNDAQSRADIAAAQEIAAENDVNVKREALRVLTGKEPPVLARLRPGVNLVPPVPADPENWAQAARQGNLEVTGQALNSELAEREVSRARGGHMPTLDLVGSYGRTHAGNGNSGAPSQGSTWQIGLQASIPLYQGGGTQARVREAIALSAKAREDLENTRRSASQLARQSYLGVTSGIAQVKGFEAAVKSSTSALESNKLGYQVGVKINKDVLDAQSQLADTQQKLAKARYDTILAQIRLKQAVGVLSLKDIEEINALLEP